MPDNKYDKSLDRQAVLFDFKNRIIDMLENGFVAPEVGIYDEPVRYLKMNEEWFKLLAGWLSWMESVAYWKDAEDETYPGIQAILEFEEGIPPPEEGEVSCEDIEDCLETSDIINNINIDIDNITNIVNELSYEQTIGDLNLPPSPSSDEAGNDVCKGANFIALRLADALLEAWEAASTLDIAEGVEALISLVEWNFTASKEFWQYVFTLSDPTLADDSVEFKDNIAQAFFCANWNLELALDFIQADSGIPSNEKALWVVTIQKFRQSQIDEWGMIGSLSATDYDCTAGCPWAVVWVFDEGSYEAEEGDTIYGLGSWELTDAELIDTGYSATDGSMSLNHALPEQCRVTGVSMRCGKHNACGQLRWTYTISPAGQSGNQFVGFADGVATGSLNAILDHMTINTQNAICSGATPPRDHISWIKLVGTGVKPSA